jgi:hypothetical protein
VAIAAFGIEAVLLSPVRALPPPPGPQAAVTPSPSPAPTGAGYLAPGSPIDFVLDDPVDSKKTSPGTVIRIHLAKALVVGGTQIAPAGTVGTLKVVSTRHAVAPDVDGAVQISLDPLVLPDHGTLPVTATKSYITIEQTAGQASTNALEDAAKDIFIPGHAIYKNFRKGRELSLPAGSILRARTAASIDATHPGAIVIATPPPFDLSTDVPHAAFTPIPLYVLPTPFPRSSPSPSPAAHASASAQPPPPAATPGSTASPR